MNASFNYPKSGNEFLSRADAELTYLLLESFKIDRVCEVGVWKGAWSTTVLANSACVVDGIDPYPAGDSPKLELEQTIRRSGFSARFRLSRSWEDLEASIRYDLIHIDALHSEAAFRIDLANALDRLNVGGIIIVDDFRHPWFPGLSHAFYSALEPNSLSVICTSANKAVVVRDDTFDTSRAALLENLTRANHFNFFDYQSGLRPGAIYNTPTDVRSRPVILIEEKPSVLKQLVSSALKMLG